MYISMILQMLQDKTVPSLIKEDKYNELISFADGEIVKDTYEQSQNNGVKNAVRNWYVHSFFTSFYEFLRPRINR